MYLCRLYTKINLSEETINTHYLGKLTDMKFVSPPSKFCNHLYRGHEEDHYCNSCKYLYEIPEEQIEDFEKLFSIKLINDFWYKILDYLLLNRNNHVTDKQLLKLKEIEEIIKRGY